MDKDNFKYDIAFSFVQEDESLANQLNDLLKSRLRTFIYSERQLELAGTDGEKTFNDVFGIDTRSVVVLYRKSWGTTPWTRIEETAIRNRAYNEGYDFVLFIPLDKPFSTPSWLPRTRIWIGLERWGIEAAASIIEERVQALGGSPHEEKVEELAAKLQGQQEFSEHRRKFLDSDEAVQLASAEFGKLVSELKRLVEEIKSSAQSFAFVVKEDYNLIVVRGWGRSLSFRWQLRCRNTLHEAKLLVALWEGFLNVRGENSWNQSRELQTWDFDFDITPTEEFGWRGPNEEKRLFTATALVADRLKIFLQEVQDLRDEQQQQR